MSATKITHFEQARMEANMLRLSEARNMGFGVAAGISPNGLITYMACWLVSGLVGERLTRFAKHESCVYYSPAVPNDDLPRHKVMEHLTGNFSRGATGNDPHFENLVNLGYQGTVKPQDLLDECNHVQDDYATPRISCLHQYPMLAEFTIISPSEAGHERPDQTFYKKRLMPGTGFCITTYDPSFTDRRPFLGPPIQIAFPCDDLEAAADICWGMLPRADQRVSLAMMSISHPTTSFPWASITTRSIHDGH